MSVGEHDPADFPSANWGDLRMAAASRLKDPRLLSALNIAYWVNFDFDVGYVCGMCTTRRGFFCDRNVPLREAPVGKNDAPVNLVPFVWLHECGELVFIEDWGDEYDEAHAMITVVEHDAVVQAGIDWRRYCRFFDTYDRRDENIANIQRTPRTIYQRPYIQSCDWLLLQRMRDTMQ